MNMIKQVLGLFLADRLVMLTVPTAALFGWLAVPILPRAIVALVLLALLAGSFSIGVLRSARSLSGKSQRAG